MCFRVTGKLEGNTLSFMFQAETMAEAIETANKLEKGWILIVL